MKKIYLFSALVGLAFQASAQTFVSTDPSKRNAVLEEFTGIHCTYCPDGHKRAQALKAANPDRVVLINIHQGSYANPGTGEPDFRTQWGDAIAGQTDLTGYPAATVNRQVFTGRSMRAGTAMSRIGTGNLEYWKLSAEEVMAENSPVNVAMKTSLDIDKRELTIEVEVYYTGNATQPTNRLNVAILQNNILGPQTGATSFYPEKVLDNGQYIHAHMLRDLLTGQWGEVLDSTNPGAFYAKTYTYKIPDNLNSIPFEMQYLEVAVFVTETTQGIITGVSGDVEIPAEYLADLSVANSTASTASDICAETIVPKVTVTNVTDNEITSFDMVATLNGTKYTKSFSGTLAKGQSTDIEWDELALPGGTYAFTIGSPSNVNGGNMLDPNFLNSKEIGISGYSFLPDALKFPFIASFEGTMPYHTGFDYSKNAAWGMSTSSSQIGAKGSRGAVMYYIHDTWRVAGVPADMLIGRVDLSQVPNPFVTYYYAYSDASYGGTPPTVEIHVSNDCGSSWSKVSSLTPDETGEPSQVGYLYQPATNHYRWVSVPLSNFGDEEVIVKLSVIPGSTGNSLWIDEVSLIDDASSIDAPAPIDFSIFPNPFENDMNVSFKLENEQPIEVKVYDATGRMVLNGNREVLGQGSHVLNLKTDGLEQGVYVVKVESDNTVLSQEVIMKR
ncbi:MAG: Omp28-related outer membrane protein [Bacteroidetes bacterium]|nr:Omp28-related outer membrane protein [Bacteroidota bacterium]